MSPIARIPLGLVVAFLGFLLVWKTEVVFTWTGTIDFAEQRIGVGQTRLFLKLIGLAVAFLGIFIATNIVSDMLTSLARVFVR
ncbi:hypothetical protein EPO34_02585 [Patescibacteria group bacterium]|nr:MAG: hypothetical protein EPO34_02585 [Patescibacteria group bacterium]